MAYQSDSLCSVISMRDDLDSLLALLTATHGSQEGNVLVWDILWHLHHTSILNKVHFGEAGLSEEVIPQRRTRVFETCGSRAIGSDTEEVQACSWPECQRTENESMAFPVGLTFSAVCRMIAQAKFTFLAVIDAQKHFVAYFQASLRIDFVSNREDGSCTLRSGQTCQHECKCPTICNSHLPRGRRWQGTGRL